MLVYQRVFEATGALLWKSSPLWKDCVLMISSTLSAPVNSCGWSKKGGDSRHETTNKLHTNHQIWFFIILLKYTWFIPWLKPPDLISSSYDWKMKPLDLYRSSRLDFYTWNPQLIHSYSFHVWRSGALGTHRQVWPFPPQSRRAARCPSPCASPTWRLKGRDTDPGGLRRPQGSRAMVDTGRIQSG